MATIKGKIIKGEGRGKLLTVPTMNLKITDGGPVEPGVYAAEVLADGEWYQAVLHMGPRPTFHEEILSIELHILDLKKDIHPDEVEVETWKRLRDVEEFDSSEALKKQIEKDIMDAHAYFED